MQLVLTFVEGTRQRDILCDLDPQATVGELACHLKGGLIDADSLPDLTCEGVSYPADLLVVESGIKNGCTVSIAAPTQGVGSPPAGLAVDVLTGAATGETLHLPLGCSTLGGNPDDTVYISALGAAKAEITVAVDGSVTVTPHQGKFSIAGHPLKGSTPWRYFDVLTAADTRLQVRVGHFRQLVRKPSTMQAVWEIRRPPRIQSRVNDLKLQIPAKPDKPRRIRIPVAMMFLPLIGAAVMVSVTGSFRYAIFALLSPMMVLANWLSSKQSGHDDYLKNLDLFEQKKARIEQEKAEAVIVEASQLRELHPNPAEILDWTKHYGARLWERRLKDDDFFTMRMGTGMVAAKVSISDPEAPDHRREDHPYLADAPVALALPAAGVLGLCGHQPTTRRLMYWFVAQIAALHSYQDVKLTVLAGSETQADWHWVAWLPHTRSDLGQASRHAVAYDSTAAAKRVSELVALVAERKAQSEQSREADHSPKIVVIIDGTLAMRGIPGILTVLQDGPDVGVFVICHDTEQSRLPNEVQELVVAAEDSTLSYSPVEDESQSGILADGMSPIQAMRAARKLASLIDTGQEEDSALPTSCRLVDLLNLEDIAPEKLLAQWMANGCGATTSLGESMDGPLDLDLIKDGPHALVAGTTGSGKSELLQSWVAGLASGYSTEEMNFVLVDYKGGSAFAECNGLPHTVGMVTDLDNHLVERCLTSLRAELHYREHILADVSCPDLGEYQKHRAEHPSVEPMPRLMIVIDEFAALAQELPDFVTGLIDVARRGRSLGIHLVLATQRPSGVVNAEIKSNMNLRIALRVNSSGDSSDVVDDPTAANISRNTPGRAVARLGHGVLIPFQTARVAQPVGQATQAKQPGWSVPFDQVAFGQDDVRPPKRSGPQHRTETDLSRFVDVASKAHALSGLPTPRKPWLPALPALLTLEEVYAKTHGTARPSGAVWGLLDLPEQQKQIPLTFNLDETNHVLVVGASKTGRTQALRTLGASLALTYTPADVHVYGIDCGNGGLLPLEDLPHCGAVVRRNETERVVKLLTKLTDEVARRSALLAKRRVANLNELRRQTNSDDPDHLPYIVVLLDRYENWQSVYGTIDAGRYDDTLMALLSDGPSVGVFAVIAGDRSVGGSRLLALTEERWILKLNDDGDYGRFGIRSASIPEDQSPGQAINNDGSQHMQVALLTENPDGGAQAAVISEIGANQQGTVGSLAPHHQPMQLRVLPAVVGYEDCWQAAAEPLVPIGLGGEDIEAIGFEPTVNPVLMISGLPKSGKSTIALAAAVGLLRKGWKVGVIAPRQSPLRDLADHPSVMFVNRETELDEDWLTKHFDGQPQTVLVIDDAETYRRDLAGQWLSQFAALAVDRGHALIVSGDATVVAGTATGWLGQVGRGQQAVFTSFSSRMDGDLAGVTLTTSMASVKPEPGKAWFGQAGSLTAIVCPLVTASDI